MKSLPLIAALGLLTACAVPSPYSAPPRPTSPSTQPGASGSAQSPASPPGSPATTAPVRPPDEPAPGRPPAREYTLSPASQALVTQARSQAASGNYAVAAGTVERAIRIDPDNPLLWIELGRVRLAEGNASQAQSLGRKAAALSGGDPRAEASAWRLVADAAREQGHSREAREAEARAATLLTR